MEKVRVDKWLWAVRIFKSRTLASDAVKNNKVKVNDELVKSSFQIQHGDTIAVKKDGFNLTYKVLDLIEMRVGAPIAQACYENLTPEAELKKFDTWYVAQVGKELRDKGTGRPTKRDRRDIERVKEGDATANDE
jgi:ribosome-associated heat shock protein Hsp15